MHARYLGPLIVIARNHGGAYILSELDGAVLDRPVAAFRVIPYFARSTIPISENFEDVSPQRIRTMVENNSQGDNEEVAELQVPEEPDDVSNDGSRSDYESNGGDDRDDLFEE
jgi:hypothetical protein